MAEILIFSFFILFMVIGTMVCFFVEVILRHKKCPKCKREMEEYKNKQTGRKAYHCPYCGEHKEV